MAQSVPGLLIGGRYRLINVVGAGGFGRVWRAFDEVLRVDVAAKELLPSSGTGQVERAVRAAREARNAAQLRDNPHIVSVHDVLDDDGQPWMIMQFVEGPSLKDRLDTGGPLPVGEVARIADALLDALGAAHAAGVVHRDVKPANVMIAGSGEVMLTDFGIAVYHEDTKLTATGAVIGSPAYMAPERFTGADRGSAGDLYSLGATLYEAVEGVLPTTGGGHDSIRPPRRAGVLGPLLLQMLDADPGRRPTVPLARAALASTLLVTEPAGTTPAQVPIPHRDGSDGTKPPVQTSFKVPRKTQLLMVLRAGSLLGTIVGLLGPIMAFSDKNVLPDLPRVVAALIVFFLLFGLVFAVALIAGILSSILGPGTMPLVITAEGVVGEEVRGHATPVIGWDYIATVRVDRSGPLTTVVIAPRDREKYLGRLSQLTRSRTFDPNSTYIKRLQGFRIFSGALDNEPDRITQAMKTYRPDLDAQVVTGQRPNGWIAELFQLSGR
ncbi:protein kinase domain-containing protein [Nocardia sp. NPDC003482]